MTPPVTISRLSAASADRITPQRALVHPLWAGALAVLLLNDHVLKDAAPGLVTGKLSDFAGLLVAPVLLACLVRARTRVGVALANGVTGAVFAVVKATEGGARAWESLTALTPFPWQVTVDPTDLVALAALPVGIAVLGRAMSGPARAGRAWTQTAFASGMLACMATSPVEDVMVCGFAGLDVADPEGPLPVLRPESPIEVAAGGEDLEADEPVVALVTSDLSGEVAEIRFDYGSSVVETVDLVAGAQTLRVDISRASDGRRVCTEAVEVVVSEAPTAEITSPTWGAILPADQPVRLEGFVSDVDDASETLTARWELATEPAPDEVMVLGEVVPDADGAVTLDWPQGFDPGRRWFRLAVSDQGPGVTVTDVMVTVE